MRAHNKVSDDSCPNDKLKLASYRRSRISQGVSVRRRDFWALNRPSSVNRALSVHRILQEESSSPMCWCYSHSQSYILREPSSGSTCALCEYRTGWNDGLEVLRGLSAGIRPIILHSCRNGIFIGWCPYSPWATCINMCLRVTPSASQRRCSSIRNKLAPRCHRTDEHNDILLIPVQQAAAGLLRYLGIGACRSVRRVCVP